MMIKSNTIDDVAKTPIEIFYHIIVLGKRLYVRANINVSKKEQYENLKHLILLIVSIVTLLIVNTAYAVYWSFLIRRFATSLQEKNEAEFYNVIYEVLLNLVLKIPLASLSEFCQGLLSLFLRRHCTKAFFKSFFNKSSKVFYHTKIENAGIRILEVENWVGEVQRLFLVIINRALNLIAFSSLMLYLSTRLFTALALYAMVSKNSIPAKAKKGILSNTPSLIHTLRFTVWDICIILHFL